MTEIPAEGGTYEVAVEYNTDFSVEVDPAAQDWYYRSIARALSDLQDSAAWQEYQHLVESIFQGVASDE